MIYELDFHDFSWAAKAYLEFDIYLLPLLLILQRTFPVGSRLTALPHVATKAI